MNDILDWLRLIEVEQLCQEEIDEAANEIEKLRAENARLSEALELCPNVGDGDFRRRVWLT